VVSGIICTAVAAGNQTLWAPVNARLILVHIPFTIPYRIAVWVAFRKDLAVPSPVVRKIPATSYARWGAVVLQNMLECVQRLLRDLWIGRIRPDVAGGRRRPLRATAAVVSRTPSPVRPGDAPGSDNQGFVRGK